MEASARCQEANVNVVFHIGSTSVERAYNTPWGLRPSPPSHRHSLMEYALSFTERPVVDTLTALISDNVFVATVYISETKMHFEKLLIWV